MRTNLVTSSKLRRLSSSARAISLAFDWVASNDDKSPPCDPSDSWRRSWPLAVASCANRSNLAVSRSPDNFSSRSNASFLCVASSGVSFNRTCPLRPSTKQLIFNSGILLSARLSTHRPEKFSHFIVGPLEMSCRLNRFLSFFPPLFAPFLSFFFWYSANGTGEEKLSLATSLMGFSE